MKARARSGSGLSTKTFKTPDCQLRDLAKSVVQTEAYRQPEPRLLRAHPLHSVLAAVANAEEGTDTEGLGPLNGRGVIVCCMEKAMMSIFWMPRNLWGLYAAK